MLLCCCDVVLLCCCVVVMLCVVCCVLCVDVDVVVVVDDSLRCAYVHVTMRIGKDPVPSHLGVKLPATPAPRGALDDEELFIV